ncbi:MAG: ABC transporter permease [Alphaproteobacteria bacterium]|nr:ABC transporter permease [Alphaproteobacteria bacterium]
MSAAIGDRLIRPIVTLAGLLLVWQAVVVISGAPVFILPGPLDVLAALAEQPVVLLSNAAVTATEIILGLIFGVILGGASALSLAAHRGARRWLLPVLVVTQALPVFALAPVLVLWLGYGMVSKVAMAVLIIYFPVTAAFYDGLRRTEPGWLDMAQVMGASKAATLRHIRLPAALPAFASGVRVGASVAPIGAVVGEWVGASAGLGAMMLHANGRMQTDTLFAALFTLCLIGLAVYYATDAIMKRLTPWRPESH